MADNGSDLYDDPLVLAHEHFYTPIDNGNRVAWEMRGDCLAGYLEFMDRNDVSTVLPFFASYQLPILQEHDDRFTPFLNDFIFTTYVNETPPDEWATMPGQLLSEHDGIAGLGEFALFCLEKRSGLPTEKPPRDPMRADHPALMDIYEVAADHDVPVMLHPFLQPPQLGSEFEERPLESPEVQSLANAFDSTPRRPFSSTTARRPSR